MNVLTANSSNFGQFSVETYRSSFVHNSLSRLIFHSQNTFALLVNLKIIFGHHIRIQNNCGRLLKWRFSFSNIATSNNFGGWLWCIVLGWVLLAKLRAYTTRIVLQNLICVLLLGILRLISQKQVLLLILIRFLGLRGFYLLIFLWLVWKVSTLFIRQIYLLFLIIFITCIFAMLILAILRITFWFRLLRFLSRRLCAVFLNLIGRRF